MTGVVNNKGRKGKCQEKPWFDLESTKAFRAREADNFHLYRIIPFDILLEMLNDKVLTLVPTCKWEDVYENFLFKETILKNGEKVYTDDMSKRFYGQCWSSSVSSDALWRIYSPDKKSVRIRTSFGKMKAILPNDDDYLLGKVQYVYQSKIENDLENLRQFTQKQLDTLILESLLVKRNSFSHEKEYRLVCHDNSGSNTPKPVKLLSIKPDFIERIDFDPRADKVYRDRCKKILVELCHYPEKQIGQSRLYSFEPKTLNLV